MGVMTCDRRGCDNIMCDTCVDGSWYVCTYCQKEFEHYLIQEGHTDLSEGQMKQHFKTFISTEAGQYSEGPKISVREFFQKYTRD